MPQVVDTKMASDKRADKVSFGRLLDDDIRDSRIDEEMLGSSDDLMPVRKTASGNFYALHEEHLVNRLMSKWNTAKDESQRMREQARRIIRKIAVEELAKDWLLSDIDAEVRSYMVNTILPTVILGLEKLLLEVEKRELVETKAPDDNFNPLNFLAQYLMRNNPKYSNFPEASPYMRGLRNVSEELKIQLLSGSGNQLIRMKLTSREKRREREMAESMSAVEEERRTEALSKQFMEWNDGKKIELALVQNTLLSFVESVSHMSAELQRNVRLSKDLDPTDDTGKGVHQPEFVEHLKPFVVTMNNTAFDILLAHMSSCAKVYRHSLETLEQKAALTQLFKACDYNKSGLLSRHRILQLLTSFYNKLPEEKKNTLRDPRHWPVREINEYEEVDEELEEMADDGRNVVESTPAGSGSKLESDDSIKDLEPITSREEMRFKETSLAVVEKAIKDAKIMLATAEGSVSPTAIEAASEQTGIVQDQEVLVKAVSAGKRMLDSGAEIIDKTRVDNWAGSFAYSSISQSQLCSFNEYTVDVVQFVQLIENFLNMSVDSILFNQLLSYIKEGYVAPDDDLTLKMMKERLTAEELQRKTKLNRLFDIWDNEGSGLLNCDEVVWILGTYKDLRQKNVVEKAMTTFRETYNFNDDKFTKHEFRDFVMSVVKILPPGETFDMFIDFLIGSIALSFAEQARGDARKKWLQHMIVVAETSGAVMGPVYKSVFDAIVMDATLHGDGKVVSASISLLERNLLDLKRGAYVLRYTAASPDHSPHILDKFHYEDMKGISFATIASGKPIHVPKISVHGNIYFWDPSKNIENTDGSYLAIPLKDKKKRIFGLLTVDTINDPNSQKNLAQVDAELEDEAEAEEFSEDSALKRSTFGMFYNHEIQFYQGIAKAFSIAYHLVNIRQKMIQTSENAILWIVRRCPSIKESTIYLVESTRETMDIMLRKMMTTEIGNKVVNYHSNPPRLERKDNFFKEYLFKCADSSELVTMTASDEFHLAIPLRNSDGQAVIIYDINLADLVSLPKSEMLEMIQALKLLQAAFKEISIESQDGIRVAVLKGDQMDNDTRTEILFGRLMLLKLRQWISRLDTGAYVNLRNNLEFRDFNHSVMKAVVCLLHPDAAKKGEQDDWQKCLPYIGPSTGAKIVQYDPTEHTTDEVPMALIENYLKGISFEMVRKHKSVLARHLYNWICISLELIKSVSKKV